MENQSGTIKQYKQNFSLDEAKLRKIVDVIREQSKKLTYETYIEFYVQRELDFFYTTQQLDEILQEDNALGRSICLLTIELYKFEPEPVDNQKSRGERKHLVYVAFTPDQDIKVRVSVTSDNRDWTSLTVDDIDTQIKRTLFKRSISSLLRYADLFIGILIVYGGMMIGFLSLEASIGSVTRADIASMTPNEQIAEILGLLIDRGKNSIYGFLIPWVVSWSFGVGIYLLHPISRLIAKSRTSFFYWGDMIQLRNKIEQRNMLITWGLGIALLVSVVGSIVATLIITR